MSVHACPWCRCLPVDDWDGRFNRDAPYAALVLEIDAMSGQFIELGAGRGKRYQ